VVGRRVGGRVAGRREVGLEAARRFKEILGAAPAPARPLTPLPPPPSFPEDRRPPKFLRRLNDDEREE
jgi:hypothetical protein